MRSHFRFFAFIVAIFSLVGLSQPDDANGQNAQRVNFSDEKTTEQDPEAKPQADAKAEHADAGSEHAEAGCGCDGGANFGQGMPCGLGQGRGLLSRGRLGGHASHDCGCGADMGCGCGAGIFGSGCGCDGGTNLRSRMRLDNPIPRAPAVGVSRVTRGTYCHTGCEGCTDCRGGLFSNVGRNGSLAGRIGGGARFGGRWWGGDDCQDCNDAGFGSRIGSRIGNGSGLLAGNGLAAGAGARLGAGLGRGTFADDCIDGDCGIGGSRLGSGLLGRGAGAGLGLGVGAGLGHGGAGVGAGLGHGGAGVGCGGLRCGGDGCHGGCGLASAALAGVKGVVGPFRGQIPHTAQPDYGAGGMGMGQQAPTYAYPYYTTRGPRDFLLDNPPTIGW